MKDKKGAGLLGQSDGEGGRIGGGALEPADFVEIMNGANQE